MANNRNYNGSQFGRKSTYGSKKSKYTKSENIAFRLGQEARIKQSIRNNPESRVSEAYQKGLKGFEPRTEKSLF